MSDLIHGGCKQPFVERYEDLETLVSILSRFNNDFVSRMEEERLYQRMLTSLLNHTGSNFGFVAQRLPIPANEHVVLKVLAQLNLNESEQQQDDSDSQLVESDISLISTLFAHGMPVISNNCDTDPRAGAPLPGDPDINTFLALPLRINNKVAGVLALGGREGGYDHPMALHLAPLAASLGALLHARQRSEEAGMTDPLTGLPNQALFQQRFAIEASRHVRKRAPLSLLHVDIDHFSNFRKHHGERAARICLKNVARVLSGNLRTEDCVMHLNESRFAVLLAETPNVRAVVVAEKLRQAVARTPVQIDEMGTTLSPTVSIGLTTLSLGGTPLEALSDAADNALAMARAHGGNQLQASLQRF